MEQNPLLVALSEALTIEPSGKSTFSLDDALDGGLSLNAAGRDRMDDLIDAMNDAAKGPDEQVKNGRAPDPPNVAVLPADADARTQAVFQHLQDLSSIISLYTKITKIALRTQRGHPDEYNITVASEATQEFADTANCCYSAMTNQLAGIFNFQSGVVQTFSKSMSKTEIHLEFLGELFKGFSFDNFTLKTLDGVLTKFVASIGTLSFSTESASQTVDFAIIVNQIFKTNVSGDDDNPIWINVPRKRIIHMHLEAGSYKWATNKASHESSTFNMTYMVTDCDLNVDKYLLVKPKLDNIFSKVMGKNMAEFAKALMGPTVKQAV